MNSSRHLFSGSGPQADKRISFTFLETKVLDYFSTYIRILIHQKEFGCQIILQAISGSPPVDLYLDFEKSSWKNQVQRTGFLACRNQFQN